MKGLTYCHIHRYKLDITLILFRDKLHVFKLVSILRAKTYSLCSNLIVDHVGYHRVELL